MKPILSVLSVQLWRIQPQPAGLAVVASGMVSTGGWRHPLLKPRFHHPPPADGFLDVDFLAEPPVGPVIQVLTPIAAQTVLQPLPEWVQGVRVHGATNHVEAPLTEAGDAIDPARPLDRQLETKPTAFDGLSTAVEAGTQRRNLVVSVAKNPGVIWWEVRVEGDVLDMASFQFEDGAWHRQLEGYPVDSPLDVVLQASGAEGGRIAARIQCEGKVLTPDLYAELFKGFASTRESYEV